jgi:thiol-disulfide isomerase/thioredoxin
MDMRTRNFILLSTYLILFSVFQGYTQRPVPLAQGSPIPNVKLEIQLNGREKPIQRSLASYQGRWLVLDFWTKTCISCIKGFPKLQQLSDSLKNEVDFLLVGNNEKKYNSGIQQMYARIAKQESLELDVAFDSVIFKAFGVWTTPHVVIISPDGLIAKSGGGSELSLTNLRNIMSAWNKPPGRAGIKASITPMKKISLEQNGPSAHMSELNADFPQASIGTSDFQQAYQNGQLQTTGLSLSSLYLLSYFGKTRWFSRNPAYATLWPMPVFELADTSSFVAHFPTGTGYYTYHLSMSQKNTPISIAMLAMQLDLEKWFGYKASIQSRQMPVYKLISLSDAAYQNLKSRSIKRTKLADHSGLELKKGEIEEIIWMLAAYHPRNIWIDQTEITGDIDISLNASLANLPSLRKALQANGLDIIPAVKLMQVLIISDK